MECEGRTIYHAGDLNWWHWEGEPDAYNEHMKTAYLKEIEKLKDTPIDVAFVPVDPRLGEQYYYGIDGFAKRVDAKALIPMHCWGTYTVCEKLNASGGDKGVSRADLSDHKRRRRKYVSRYHSRSRIVCCSCRHLGGEHGKP